MMWCHEFRNRNILLDMSQKYGPLKYQRSLNCKKYLIFLSNIDDSDIAKSSMAVSLRTCRQSRPRRSAPCVASGRFVPRGLSREGSPSGAISEGFPLGGEFSDTSAVILPCLILRCQNQYYSLRKCCVFDN